SPRRLLARDCESPHVPGPILKTDGGAGEAGGRVRVPRRPRPPDAPRGPMRDRQRRPRRGRGTALLFVWMFLTLSLAGYDPADPPGSAAEPPNPIPRNPCGPVGATLAWALFQAIGWASALLLLAWAALAVLILRRRWIPEAKP